MSDIRTYGHSTKGRVNLKIPWIRRKLRGLSLPTLDFAILKFLIRHLFDFIFYRFIIIFISFSTNPL